MGGAGRPGWECRARARRGLLRWAGSGAGPSMQKVGLEGREPGGRPSSSDRRGHSDSEWRGNPSPPSMTPGGGAIIRPGGAHGSGGRRTLETAVAPGRPGPPGRRSTRGRGRRGPALTECLRYFALAAAKPLPGPLGLSQTSESARMRRSPGPRSPGGPTSATESVLARDL